MVEVLELEVVEPVMYAIKCWFEVCLLIGVLLCPCEDGIIKQAGTCISCEGTKISRSST